MNKIYQGNISTEFGTKIICNSDKMIINTIIINNTETNYIISINTFIGNPGIHKIPIYTFSLNAGDTVRDTDEYILYKDNYLELNSNVAGTSYYINTTEE